MTRGDWYGVVEGTRDPLKLGRVQVRIKGIHTDNKLKLPSADLPWASVQQAPNVHGEFSVLLEGTNVLGYFADGHKSQMPIVTGTIPSVFASIATVFGNDWIKRDKPNGIPSYGTINSTSVSYAAQGDVSNTVIATTNRNLEHACDFKYFINLPTLSIASINNPITEITNSIKAGKNRSAQLMSLLLTQLNTQLRAVINALLPALGLDPSGIASKSYSIAKDLVREINAITKQVAMIAETASLYYNLVLDIQKIVDYLNSLPDRIKSIVQGCVAQFLGSIQQFIDMLKSLPGMYDSSMENMLAQLGSSSQAALDTANTASANTANTSITELVSITVFNTDVDHANIIMDYINTNYGNASVTLANSTANSFSKSASQTP